MLFFYRIEVAEQLNVFWIVVNNAVYDDNQKSHSHRPKSYPIVMPCIREKKSEEDYKEGTEEIIKRLHIQYRGIIHALLLSGIYP